ncbi:ABC transporter ATP-binding protein [Gimesia fumaroli]|uniref:Putative ABC transporter ATP-binding protein YbhF n=1 Tax=Gimesia fumaroli TaxID=2527976 RepID=A0A518IG43_9PLAN|nr:ATP-binding cassette domain-containing protein [Gimesia fumaroli]QDV52048.1 putative ABC transporter ATP-binding protein YbhF [Gimesia fumaroli]
MILVKELTRIFEAGTQDVLAVDHISFEVQQGEVYGLLGPNGAGKTTTLRMILGLLKPTSGDAEVEGFLVSSHPDEIKRRVGLVSTSAGLYQWLTPREILSFFADVYGVPRVQAEDQIEKLSRLFEISPFLDRRSATLSTGQKQRINLARSLIHDPPVMLMDEPTRGLDVVGSKVIFDYIDLLRDEGKAVIVCTHRLDEAEQLCDRFGLLHNGKICYEGTLAELQQCTSCQTLTQIFLQLLDAPVEPAESIPIAQREFI